MLIGQSLENITTCKLFRNQPRTGYTSKVAKKFQRKATQHTLGKNNISRYKKVYHVQDRLLRLLQ